MSGEPVKITTRSMAVELAKADLGAELERQQEFYRAQLARLKSDHATSRAGFELRDATERYSEAMVSVIGVVLEWLASRPIPKPTHEGD